MEIIYADSLFFLNFIIDYLLLLACGRICAVPLRRARMLLAAFLGGAYALAAVIKPEPFALPAVKLLCGAGLCLTAFGLKGRPLARIGVFFSVAAAFGGAVYAACTLGGVSLDGRLYIPVSFRVLVLSFALSYAVLGLLFRRSGKKVQRQLCSVLIGLGGRTLELTALRDTGNELTEPVSGESIVLCQAGALVPLIPEAGDVLCRADLLSGFETLAACPQLKGRLRLIPAASALGEKELLPCFRPDSLSIDGKKSGAYIALSPRRLAGDGEFQALI